MNPNVINPQRNQIYKLAVKVAVSTGITAKDVWRNTEFKPHIRLQEALLLSSDDEGYRAIKQFELEQFLNTLAEMIKEKGI